MKKETGYTLKLGMFVTIGLALFIVIIFMIGNQHNLFGSTFRLKTQFKTVSGLKEGNNVRFSGINVGTVDKIILLTDTTVLVESVLKKDVQQFIKTDARAAIGSDGLMGDRVLTIYPGAGNVAVADKGMIQSQPAIEMEDLMASVKTNLDNATVITGQMAEFSYKINNGHGALSRLMSDEGLSNSLDNTLSNLETSTTQFAKFTTKMNDKNSALAKLTTDKAFGAKLDSTMTNLEAGTKGLSENMEAAKHNFLLRGYFKKKEKAAAKKKAALQKEQQKNKKKTQSDTGKSSITVADSKEK